jgi:hypothetical protein
MNAKTRKRVRDLHARIGSSYQGASATALRKLLALLQKHSKTWNDLADILAVDATVSSPPPDPRDAGVDPYAGTTITPADLVHHVASSRTNTWP